MLLYMNKGKVICRLSHVLCPFHYPNHGRFMLFFSKFTDAFGAAEHLNNKHFMCMIIPILDLKGVRVASRHAEVARVMHHRVANKHSGSAVNALALTWE